MRKLAVLTAVALVGLGSMIATTDAEARSRRNTSAVVAAGVAGIAVGGLIGATTSNAYAAPAYGYSYPAYAYPSSGYAPVTTPAWCGPMTTMITYRPQSIGRGEWSGTLPRSRTTTAMRRCGTAIPGAARPTAITAGRNVLMRDGSQRTVGPRGPSTA